MAINGRIGENLTKTMNFEKVEYFVNFHNELTVITFRIHWCEIWMI